MGKNNLLININGARLKSELYKRNVVCAELSRALGYSDKYIVNCCDSNRIRSFIVNLLEAEYGIMPEWYVIPNEPEPTPDHTIQELTETEKEDSEYIFKISSTELEELITRAVCKGIQMYDKSESKF